MTKTTCSVIGLGKLGASMAAAIASRGFHVIGVDINPEAVERLNAGRAPVQETDLDALISKHRERLSGTTDTREAVHGSQLSFVIVPTPSDENGAFALGYAAKAFAAIGRALKDKGAYHNVVLTSTVLPGATRHGLLPILERESGKRCGRDFGLCYSPEFIALGSVIRDFLNPDFTLVGEFDDRCGSALEEFYRQVMVNGAPCKRMSIENAELAKISVNAYVTTKITFANILADLCERIPGGDVDVVTDALGADSRIGARYLKGGAGYGGPCFPRDNVALGFAARALGASAPLSETTDRVNRALPEAMVERLKTAWAPGDKVAVLGLAYKPRSQVIEESMGVYLALALAGAGARVTAYDPLANETARGALGATIEIADSIGSCLKGAKTVMVTTPDAAFESLSERDFDTGEGRVTVIDFWRILAPALRDAPGFNYVPVGCCTDDDANRARLHALWGRAEADG